MVYFFGADDLFLIYIFIYIFLFKIEIIFFSNLQTKFTQYECTKKALGEIYAID